VVPRASSKSTTRNDGTFTSATTAVAATGLCAVVAILSIVTLFATDEAAVVMMYI